MIAADGRSGRRILYTGQVQRILYSHPPKYRSRSWLWISAVTEVGVFRVSEASFGMVWQCFTERWCFYFPNNSIHWISISNMVAHICPVKRSRVIFNVLVTFPLCILFWLLFVSVFSFAFSLGCFLFRLYFCFGCFLFNLICLLPLLLSPSPSPPMHPSLLCTNWWWWLYVNGAGAKMTMPAPKRCVIVIVATPLISRTIWSEQQLNQFLQDMLHNPPSIYLLHWPIMSFHSFNPFLWTIFL